jgi:hypothetical protein
VRFLLDTNLVEYGWRFRIGTEESSVASMPDPPHARLARDLRVLETLFALAQRHGSLEFRVAPASEVAVFQMTWTAEYMADEMPLLKGPGGEPSAAALPIRPARAQAMS